MAMVGMVLLAALPAFAQENDPILSPGFNFAGDAEDVCSALAQEDVNQVVIPFLGIPVAQESIGNGVFVPPSSPQNAEVIDSCNDVFNTYQDTNTVTPSLEFEQDAESGDFDTASELSVTGDNNQLCTPMQQSGNTGNSLNQEGAQPTQGGFDDFEAGDSTLETAAHMPTECALTFGQSAAASS
ncbi:MAG: hypothetical protein AVDCRST_MAG93-6774 [uncultured Chloroflexia bacterium]|uniref:Uncharacterized protein n=1 Tax=uncultured Chloroflexia bacterium TaxID=1672391 RepID=A0A6J4LYV5_9CHLR|nr:MAG: hypothetical protein AVDCRST_MAG93-6774 [uncultured Chloroflexia bacterium]